MTRWLSGRGPGRAPGGSFISGTANAVSVAYALPRNDSLPVSVSVSVSVLCGLADSALTGIFQGCGLLLQSSADRCGAGRLITRIMKPAVKQGKNMQPMIWKDYHHTELPVAECYQMLALRNQIFIVEQQCLYQDIDGEDLRGDNRHLLGFRDGVLVAYARILVTEEAPQEVSIGRVIVAPAARGQGLAYLLLDKLLESCRLHFTALPVHLSAQAHLQAFYAGRGFVAEGEIYQEDGIDHITMRLKR